MVPWAISIKSSIVPQHKYLLSPTHNYNCKQTHILLAVSPKHLTEEVFYSTMDASISRWQISECCVAAFINKKALI